MYNIILCSFTDAISHFEVKLLNSRFCKDLINDHSLYFEAYKPHNKIHFVVRPVVQ